MIYYDKPISLALTHYFYFVQFPSVCFAEELQSGDSGAGVEDMADGTEARGQEAKAGEEDGGISAPLVLSKERMEEVRRRLHTLEEQLARLQVRETHKPLMSTLPNPVAGNYNDLQAFTPHHARSLTHCDTF